MRHSIKTFFHELQWNAVLKKFATIKIFSRGFDLQLVHCGIVAAREPLDAKNLGIDFSFNFRFIFVVLFSLLSVRTETLFAMFFRRCGLRARNISFIHVLYVRPFRFGKCYMCVLFETKEEEEEIKKKILKLCVSFAAVSCVLATLRFYLYDIHDFVLYNLHLSEHTINPFNWATTFITSSLHFVLSFSYSLS